MFDRRPLIFAILTAAIVCVSTLAQPPWDQTAAKADRKGKFRSRDKSFFKKEIDKEQPPSGTSAPKLPEDKPSPEKPITEIVQPKVVPEFKPRVVYRYGKLPEKIPAWFSEYDLDQDGQVGVYEWKKLNDDLSDFFHFDLNKDGFVTAEEFLRVNK